jgi:hypothetical protein
VTITEATVTFPTWWPCERCTRTGSPSRLDPRLCEVCLPDPAVAASLAADAGDRARLARAAAALSTRPKTDLAVAPDVHHVWLHPIAWGCPHLFHAGETVSYCAKVETEHPVNLATAHPAMRTVPGCRACWRSFRAGHRRPV